MFKLRVLTGNHSGVEFTLRDEDESVFIGKAPGNQVRLLDEGVSRKHARFFLNNESEWSVEDQGSRNGVLVNKKKIAGPMALKPGDKITFGTTVISFEEGDADIESDEGTLDAPYKTDLPVPGRAAASHAQPDVDTDASGAIPLTIEVNQEKGGGHTGAPSRAIAEPDDKDLEAIRQLAKGYDVLKRQIRKVIVGQDTVIDQLLICLFAQGHCLLIGVPGLAKTLLIKTLASILDLDFKRIQFTPDLMPSDITGTDILEEDPETHQREFRFIKGPIFTNVLLADEINRTPPKTQAALLEAMQEYRVTAGGVTYELARPFFVLATQNPLEQEGTYPLPEAQLDRFMFNVIVDYPRRDEEIDIIRNTTQEMGALPKKVLSGDQILSIQRIVRRCPVSDHVVTYAADLVRATRPDSPEAPRFIKDWLSWGGGPRAGQYLIFGAKALCVLQGRYNVTCDDVRKVALPVLRHRIFCNFKATSDGITTDKVVAKLIETVKEPGPAAYAK